MKKIYPVYSEEFECVAGKCPDTCCAQWEIVVDEKFQKIYKESRSAAAKEAVKAMYTDDDGDVCLRLNNGRCPMLNSDNLCRLYIDMGRDSLCDVCRIYPRFNKEADEFCFSGISLSCPEAARLILEDKSYGKLNIEPEFSDSTSGLIFDIFLSLINISAKGSFFDILPLADKVQEELDFGDGKTALGLISDYKYKRTVPCPDDILKTAKKILSYDILTDEWRKLVTHLAAHLEKSVSDRGYRAKRDSAFFSCSQMQEIKNTGIYYLYKYMPEAIESGDILTTVLTSYAALCVTCELYAMELINLGSLSSERKLRLAQLFSKETEHNEDNINNLI